VTAFEDRFDELWAAAYRVAFRMLGDREDAADVAQEAVARVALRWERVEDHPAALAAKIAAGRAIDLWRRRQRARRAGRGGPSTLDSPGEAVVDDRAELVVALRRLPPRQRDAVVLRYLADLSESDTARALGCSPGTVKQHTSRGLGSLRSALATTTPE